MEEEARKRKERLAALRKRKQTSTEHDQTEKPLTFRSYTPNDEKLKAHVDIATPADIGDTVESETKNLTKEALEEAAKTEKDEVDLFNLAPKKPNWDLKRDVEKKLEKLDRKTQRAILEIIRARLAANSDKSATIAEAVANAEKQQRLEAEDDE